MFNPTRIGNRIRNRGAAVVLALLVPLGAVACAGNKSTDTLDPLYIAKQQQTNETMNTSVFADKLMKLIRLSQANHMVAYKDYGNERTGIFPSQPYDSSQRFNEPVLLHTKDTYERGYQLTKVDYATDSVADGNHILTDHTFYLVFPKSEACHGNTLDASKLPS